MALQKRRPGVLLSCLTENSRPRLIFHNHHKCQLTLPPVQRSQMLFNRIMRLKNGEFSCKDLWVFALLHTGTHTRRETGSRQSNRLICNCHGEWKKLSFLFRADVGCHFCARLRCSFPPSSSPTVALSSPPSSSENSWKRRWWQRRFWHILQLKAPGCVYSFTLAGPPWRPHLPCFFTFTGIP